jgi:hypothetical protein
MAEIHSATAGELTRELVEAVADEIAKWSDIACSQAAGVHPNDSEAAARFAIADLTADLRDHLGIGVSIVLATYGITARGRGGEHQ